MEAIIDAIRAALAEDATADVRAAGVAACRSVLAALEPKSTATPAPFAAAGIANLVATVRGAPPEQLLDLAIAKLRAVLPADAQPSPVQPLKFLIVPTPKRRGTP